jgi:tight adherence protein C
MSALIAALSGSACAALLWLLARWALAIRSAADVPDVLPWPYRAVLRVAGTWAPSLAGLWPARWLAAESQALARLGWPGVQDAAQWLTGRLLLGLCVALGSGALAFALTEATGWRLLSVAGGMLAGQSLLPAWRRRRLTARELQVLKDLPSYLDVLTLCVESGASLSTAMRMALENAPASPLRSLFEEVLNGIRSGETRVEALERVGQRAGIECFSTLVSALVQGEGQGVSLGRLLRIQSEQRSAERFSRAERLAMQAPVKLLGPLILCIFPCTFIVIGVPVVARLLEANP